MDQLDVDGARPAIARVAALPRAWTTEGERLVLFALAADSYDGETTLPGYDNVAAWTGLQRSSVTVIMAALAAPNDRRPSLLARDQTTGGGRRTVWRLLLPQPVGEPDRLPTEPVGEADRLPEGEAYPQPAGWADRFDRSTTQTGKDAHVMAKPVRNRSAPPTGNRSAPPTAPVTTPLNPPVVEVGAQLQDARELPGQLDVNTVVAEIVRERAELALATPLRLIQYEHELADPDADEHLDHLSHLEIGPCVKCRRKTHRYGPTMGGSPLCPSCRKARTG